MAYDAIRDTHSSRSPSATPIIDTSYPFHPTQVHNGPGRNGTAVSPHYHEASSPYDRPPYPGQYERQASSRPGSSGGLRGLLNDDEEPGGFPDRRSSGSTQGGQGQVPSHRREYRHPSIGSVLGGAGSPGSMSEGRSLSMLLNGPPLPAPSTHQGVMATPSSTTAMTPGPGQGMTPTHYPSPSPLGSYTKSPRFAVPLSSGGGQPREYPFPPTPTGSQQHSQRSPALYGLYNPQRSPTYQSRPLPPTSGVNSQTGFPLTGYRPPSRGSHANGNGNGNTKASSPSPSVTSIHNLISSNSNANSNSNSENKPYRSPSVEARSVYGAVGQPRSQTRTRMTTPGETHSVPISRNPSGGYLPDGHPDPRDQVNARRTSARFEGTVSPQASERRSSILGWTGEPVITPVNSNRSLGLNGLVSPRSPSDEVGALRYVGGGERSRRLSVIELASPPYEHGGIESHGYGYSDALPPSYVDISPANPTPRSERGRDRSRSPVPAGENENEMMDVDIPDGASALDVLASLSERAGSGRARERELRRESGSEVDGVKMMRSEEVKKEDPVEVVRQEEVVEEVKKEEEREESVDSYDEVTTEVVDRQGDASDMKVEEIKEEEKPAVREEAHVTTSPPPEPPEPRIEEDRVVSPVRPASPIRAPSPVRVSEPLALSPSARAASPFDMQNDGPQTPEQSTAIDLAAQIFPADEKPEAVSVPPAMIPESAGRTEYKPRRLTAPLSVLEPLSAQDWAWYLDARNCLNPLRKGCPFRTMAEGKDRVSGPPGGEGTSSSISGRKRARDSPYTNGDGYQEEDNGWPMKRARKGPVDALNEQSEVAAHYNARGNTGRAARTQSVTYGLKKCNNWIKSLLINRFTRRRPGVIDFDVEDRGARSNGRVLDMGCGKGGDIEKWNKQKIEEYVGIDVASGSIQDFEERLRTYKKRLWFQPHLYVLDCFSFPITVAVPRRLLDPKFDTISMQFCMHYAFESETKVRQMLENISNSLRTGGTFLGTTLSERKVLDLLEHIPEDATELSIGNPYYNIVFDKREYEGVYGHAYRFTLADAVEDCSEYIVHWDPFRELALSYGLKEIYRKDFEEVYEEEQHNPDSVQLAERMEVTRDGQINMDPEQWSACSIYMAFAFMKVA